MHAAAVSGRSQHSGCARGGRSQQQPNTAQMRANLTMNQQGAPSGEHLGSCAAGDGKAPHQVASTPREHWPGEVRCSGGSLPPRPPGLHGCAPSTSNSTVDSMCAHKESKTFSIQLNTFHFGENSAELLKLSSIKNELHVIDMQITHTHHTSFCTPQ